MRTQNIDSLKTITNCAKSMNITPVYIYKMIREGKMQAVIIDGVKFIDTSKTKFSTTRK
ncbi:MAG: hypothetical protein IPN99_01365 [Bacteroidetes bacterium]|nr:hypothetical protein [Bacteroidota bacterium]